MVSVRQKGLVLLTTITMILVLSLLALSMLQAVFLYGKVNNKISTKHEELYRLEALAFKLSVSQQNDHCVSRSKDANQVVKQVLEGHGCPLKEHNHHCDYLIVDLGIYPCLIIASGAQVYSSHHWLITISSAPPRQDTLQLRIARPVKLEACPFTEINQIHQGVVSWRYLPFAKSL